jgi:predicted nucleotidyltransferase
LIGASAANAQGARIATVDMDLWFEDATDPRIAEATNAAGGVWVSGTFGMRPPQIGGLAKADRFDVVTHAHGLDAFEQEFDRAQSIDLDGVMVKILPLKRIIVSKRAAGRPRDLAQIPALEEALAVLTEK